MAKFVYRMQNILNIKYKLEEQAKQEYADAQYAYQQEVDKLKHLETRKQQNIDEMRRFASESINVIELERCNDAMYVLDNVIANQKNQVFHAQAKLDRARTHLNEAMQERKTHEKLKEHQFDSFLQELNVEEMKEIDELVSYKYNSPEEGE